VFALEAFGKERGMYNSRHDVSDQEKQGSFMELDPFGRSDRLLYRFTIGSLSSASSTSSDPPLSTCEARAVSVLMSLLLRRSLRA
jgi:hypothetical protein